MVHQIINSIFQSNTYILTNDKYCWIIDIGDIDKILDYENLANDYNEDLADPVKNKYNKDAKTEDLIAYFGVWFKGLFK